MSSVGRLVPLLRTSRLGVSNYQAKRNVFYSSKHIFLYRDQGKPDPRMNRMGHRTMLVVWTWLFYHIINNWKSLMGNDVFPDLSTYTNAELGVE
ncbi:unnamed protein product [Calicophoron daubneyi]|uniref:NADH dehydrogenase [ubiquinone] 1 beta subcomplex subunit 2, mitochondrial n=1 Tax=Calicophoron daubneyi TaxID=300641 RepID=A0AAV2TBA0_CALDB